MGRQTSGSRSRSTCKSRGVHAKVEVQAEVEAEVEAVEGEVESEVNAELAVEVEAEGDKGLSVKVEGERGDTNFTESTFGPPARLLALWQSQEDPGHKN